MPKKYHAISSKFAAGPLADFCATYYVVATTFGNHWDDIRADDYERLRELPPKRYAKSSAFRLFCLRRYIQKGIELMGFPDALRLSMFDLPRDQLQHRHSDSLEGIIIDAWIRPRATENHVEFIIYVDDIALRHVSCPCERVDELITTRAKEEIDDYKQLRLNYTLTVTGYEDLLYVSRLSVPNRSHTKIGKLLHSATPSKLAKSILAPKAADTIAQSICTSTNGKITFELFVLYESDDSRHLSELCFYAVEPIKFISSKVDPESHLHAIVTCTDDSGSSYVYRAEWNSVRRLQQGQYLLALTKRIWNTQHRFILEYEPITAENSVSFKTIAENNLHTIESRFVLTAAEELLSLLPQEGTEYPISQLTVGQRVVHPDYGPGVLEGFENSNHVSVARFHFSGRKYDNARILIPTTKSLPAYWSDVMLF